MTDYGAINPFGTLTPEQEQLEEALRANEARYASKEIDLREYQRGIDEARAAYRAATLCGYEDAFGGPCILPKGHEYPKAVRNQRTVHDDGQRNLFI